MFDQQAVHDSEDLLAPSDRRGWVALVSTADPELVERYGRLLERAEIPFLLEDTVQENTTDAEPTQAIAVHVSESCFDRACEVVARDHAETSDGRDEEDEILDDDPLLDDGEDDVLNDDSDNHSGGEPDEP